MCSKIHHGARLCWVDSFTPLAGGLGQVRVADGKGALGTQQLGLRAEQKSGNPSVYPVMSGAGICGSWLRSLSFW